MIRSAGLLLYKFMLLKITKKRLFDRNTLYSPIVHHIHGYCYRLLLLILFTVYMVTDCYCTVIVTVTALSQCYR